MNNFLKTVSNFTLPRHRKTEPTLLWWTKVVVSIILLSGLIAYIYFLIDLIIRDVPLIQHSTDKLNPQQLFPSFDITMFRSNVIIDCKFSFYDMKTDYDCSANIESSYDGNYKFTPTDNMIIGDGSSNRLHLSWDSDPEYDSSNITFGKGLNDLKKRFSDQISLRTYIDYLKANNTNTELVQENQYNSIQLKWTKGKYLIRDWTNYLGFLNSYIFLDISEPIALTPRTNEGNWTEVSIASYGSNPIDGFTNEYFETVIAEKRSQTVLSNIGSLGGAISILLGIYAILFGGTLLSPWGIFQNCCCKYKSRSKRKLLNNLPMIPLTEKNPLHYERSKDPDISEIKEELTFLITRFHSLETILREYVINSDFLDELETRENK